MIVKVIEGKGGEREREEGEENALPATFFFPTD